MRGRHPDLRPLLDHLDDPAREAELAEFAAHCDRCRAEADLVRTAATARRWRRWTSPPADLSQRARRFPGRPHTPPPPHEVRPATWVAGDVRAHPLGGSSPSHLVSEIVDDAEISVAAVPPDGDGTWRIEGRIWLRRGEGAIRLVLRQDDHVLVHTATRDGEFFELDEPVGPGWVLEIHLPSGEVVAVEDPRP